jgi:putative membrane protein
MNMTGKIAKTVLVFGVGSAMAIAQTSNPASAQNPPAASSTVKGHGNHGADHGMNSAQGMGVLVGKSDEQFITKAAQGGLMEVEVGKLAQEKGSSNEVKEYGKKLEQDHSKANEQLKHLAETKNVPMPTDMGPEKAAVDKLRALSGDQFDKAFLKMAVKDHKKDVNEFQKQSTNSMDSDVKEFASKTLPTLQQHLKEAEELRGSTRGRKAVSDATSKAGSTADAATKAPSSAPATPSK